LLVTVTGRVFAEDRVLDIAIHNAEPRTTPPVLTVRQNDQVVIRLTSDEPLHVHLRGYDIESDEADGTKEQQVSFKWDVVVNKQL
jgi:hypothetical protein